MKRSLDSNDTNGHGISKIANIKDSSTTLHPTNPLVGPLLTDMYQISMTYAHWKSDRYNDDAVFDLFFRTNPFHGEYCIFAGSDEVLRFISSFRFSESDVNYLRDLMGESCDAKFFDWLLTLDCSKVKVYMMQEGSIVFPREPLIRIEGPLVIGQLLETTLLNLINFPSLVATCAARMRLAAGRNKTLLEFGLRRAQGPDGGLSASKYAYLGGFNGTSNVLAGKLFGLKVSGTHAHAYVMAHVDIESLFTRKLMNKLTGIEIDFVDLVLEIRTFFGFLTTNIGELAAFIEYAQAFPNGFLALVDTYDTLQSGVPNFISVAVALYEVGYIPKGIRLDSGDLAYLSKETRKMFHHYEEMYKNQRKPSSSTVVGGVEAVVVQLSQLNIVASNDINEKVLRSLNEEKHEIDTFGIGTHLVTCYEQPALGCVYKLVEINKIPRIKLSQNVEKLVIPGSKSVYRLYGKDGRAILDIMQFSHEPIPLPNVTILCRDPFRENKRAYVTPLKVIPLLNLVWDHGIVLNNTTTTSSSLNVSTNELIASTDSSSSSNSTVQISSTLDASRTHCEEEILSLREDHVRGLNPTPYKVSVSQALYDFLHQLWSQEAPIAVLS